MGETIADMEVWSDRLPQFVKRISDVAISALGLIFLMPFLLIIAILVRIESKGPGIYRHKRIGKDGKSFDLLKFRTMYIGSDDSSYIRYLQELIESSKNGMGIPYQKMASDPRITRIGHFLRRYYLDELPQLWNILKGDMSLVGPRPHVKLEVDHYTSEQRRRLAVKPGATGLWQVDGKADCTFGDLLDLDLKYIDEWSVALDMQILWRTIVLMLRGGEGVWARMSKTIPPNTRVSKPNKSSLGKPNGSVSTEFIVISENQQKKG